MAGEDADETIIARCASEPVIFEMLVTRHSTMLHGYLARRAPDVADDLLAEVWLTAFRRRGDFDPARGSLPGWLFGIARRHVLAHRRAVAVGLHRAAAATSELSRDDGGWAAVDARLDAAATGAALRAALNELPEVERELLLLTAWEDRSPAEAAEVLGIPAGTARSRLHRARARMRELIDLPHEMPIAGSTTHRTEHGHG